MDLVTKLYQITVQQTNELHIEVDKNLNRNTIIYANIEVRIRFSKG